MDTDMKDLCDELGVDYYALHEKLGDLIVYASRGFRECVKDSDGLNTFTIHELRILQVSMEIAGGL